MLHSKLANLSISSSPALPFSCGDVSEDRAAQKIKNYAQSLPYAIESESEMQAYLDFIIRRLTQCVEAKDYEVGFIQWDSMLTYWMTLKYPIPKEKRVLLAKLYFHLSVLPGMPTTVVAVCADGMKNLTKSKKKITIDDLRLPWRPIYDILSKDLFLARRQFEYTQTSWIMGYIAENSQRFFHPAAIDEMLSTFVPSINGTNLNDILSSQYYLLTFLPTSHPQKYLPMLFRLWEAFNSYAYDDRMLQFLSKLAEMHVDPTISNPRRIEKIPDDEKSEGEERPAWKTTEESDKYVWSGIFNDVGIFTDHEWHFLMCKCLASMEIPLADSGSLNTGSSADRYRFEINRLPKPMWRIHALARIIVHSMAQDGMPAPVSAAGSPMFTPLPSGISTPVFMSTSAADYLSSPLSLGQQVYIGGSKALDSLARLIASTESFFHPSNSGAWTGDLTAFIKLIVYEFNKRWLQEQKPDCKTPPSRRLTKKMRRELVKCLRTVAMLSMFSQDSSTVSNVQSCLKSMCVMEPDLILQPILERTVPALEALVETQRTIAMIKALGAIVPSLASRSVYYAGSKHLVSILQLLIPGIDLNDPTKTLCTTAFLADVFQYIKIGDLTSTGYSKANQTDSELLLPANGDAHLPSFSIEEIRQLEMGLEPHLSQEDEDELLKDSTRDFADWITSFIRRVILLLENLPEEGPDGQTGGASEAQLVDAVMGCCSQICVHLSEPLFDLVLDMMFEYASTNARSNAVRAVHQLVQCVANANAPKTLAKFIPFCTTNIRLELENGASSTRTTSASRPVPSDATLHWNLAILRGAVYNDGRSVAKYREELLSVLQLLHRKALSKRGFSWTGKLLGSLLLTMTHTYPLENKFVNPDEWDSEDFKTNHHHYWGKLYHEEEAKIQWHVPSPEEVDFTLQIFHELIEPTIEQLEQLLEPGRVRDSSWRNDFCRHLSLVRNAFSGCPTFVQEKVTQEDQQKANESSDILNEIPEMIASVPPMASGFCLTDTSDVRHQYMTSLKHRFGRLLHQASVSLRQQGEENTVDAVHMLIKGLRTFFLEYGDSRDSYYVNENQYNSEKDVACLFAGQKVWPRSVLVRRARFYHAARLRWNSIERRRGPLENLLITDLGEWSLWHYAVVRQASQGLLDSLCTSYDGVRQIILPMLYKNLVAGTDSDRMKGALWTLCYSSFAKYAVSEYVLLPEFVKNMFACQHNEKPSVQARISVIFEHGLTNLVEPCFFAYEIPTPAIDSCRQKLQALLPPDSTKEAITQRCAEMRQQRFDIIEKSLREAEDIVMQAATSSKTHWKYSIVATKTLRTLLRRDMPVKPSQFKFFLQKISDDQSDVRYYSQRAIMKIGRVIKHRSTCLANPFDLALHKNYNPLRREVVCRQTFSEKQRILSEYNQAIPLQEQPEPIYMDMGPGSGWLVWGKTRRVYCTPHESKSTFLPWEKASQEALDAAREMVTAPEFWKKLTSRYSEESSETEVTQDNISCVKTIFQLLEDEPWEALRPTLESLLANKNKDHQRAAAELTAGILTAAKHWPLCKQRKLWDWFTPFIPSIFKTKIKTETLSIWTSFLEWMFYHKDPRRVWPLLEFLLKELQVADFNGESSFDAMKILALLKGVYTELKWKFSAWLDTTIERTWPEIYSEHDDVRAYIGEFLAFSAKMKWEPRVSQPTVECLVKECRIVPVDFDIIGMRGYYHRERVQELVGKFQVWRSERLPGGRAFQSTYDRVGITVCRWLFQSLHDIHAISVFDYILPLMPELFRFTEVNDNDELVLRASVLLVRMCGVTPPRILLKSILEAMFDAIQNSPSWKVRLKALPLVQVLYFRQLPLFSEAKITEILEVLCKSLDDEVVEVREMAARTMAGILRLSPRRSVLILRDRFVRLASKSQIPSRLSPNHSKAIRERHAAILGICALVDSYPYSIPEWMPKLLTNVLAEHTFDPIPISTTIQKSASSFRKTHQDTWHEDSKRFTENQLTALSTLLTGSTYYA